MNTGGPGDWVLSNQTVDASGRATDLPSWFGACLPAPPAPSGTTEGPVRVQGPDTMDACFTRLNAEGYRQHVVYQPASRFWPLQWAETGAVPRACPACSPASASGGSAAG